MRSNRSETSRAGHTNLQALSVHRVVRTIVIPPLSADRYDCAAISSSGLPAFKLSLTKRLRADGRAYAASDSLRLYHHLPLSLPAAHNGHGAAYCRPQDDGSPHERRALQRRSPVLGTHFFGQFPARRRHRHPDGVSVRHELVGVFPAYRWRDWPAACHGRRLFLLSRVCLPRPLPFRRKTSLKVRSLGSSLPGISRLLDLRLLHHHYRCVDAASGSIPASAERHL